MMTDNTEVSRLNLFYEEKLLQKFLLRSKEKDKSIFLFKIYTRKITTKKQTYWTSKQIKSVSSEMKIEYADQ
jgi:hypothetical protein